MTKNSCLSIRKKRVNELEKELEKLLSVVGDKDYYIIRRILNGNKELNQQKGGEGE